MARDEQDEQSANDKEKEKDRKTHQVAATSPLAFVSRRARRREKTVPLCEREEVPYVPVRRSAENEKKKERKRKKRGSSQSPERRRVTERGEGKCTPQSNVKGGGRVQKRGAKGGGGDVSQKKGDGEARENDLESFHSFRRVTKSAVGTSPKSASHVTYS